MVVGLVMWTEADWPAARSPKLQRRLSPVMEQLGTGGSIDHWMSSPEGSASVTATLWTLVGAVESAFTQTQRTVSSASTWMVAVRVAGSTVELASSQDSVTNTPGAVGGCWVTW